MLPGNIDLTENRDFSGGSSFILSDIRIGEFVDNEFMTVDQFDNYMEHVGIFGKTRHTTQAREVLGILYDLPDKNINDWNHHCVKCGKSLKVPWNNLGGICPKCDSEINSFGKIPWKPFDNYMVYVDNIGEQNRIKDNLFHVR